MLKLLTVAEAAAKLGVSRQMLLKYVAAGRIPVVEFAGRKFVEPRHARKPKANRPGPKPAEGRPKSRPTRPNKSQD